MAHQRAPVFFFVQFSGVLGFLLFSCVGFLGFWVFVGWNLNLIKIKNCLNLKKNQIRILFNFEIS
jgi:hypothetical protein